MPQPTSSQQGTSPCPRPEGALRQRLPIVDEQRIQDAAQIEETERGTMTARRMAYEPDRDFMRVRGFLNETYSAFATPVSWALERWNYARHFIAPMIGAYGKEGDPQEYGRAAIALWEKLVRVWEDDSGEIVGATCIEHPDPSHQGFGEIFVQRHPEHLELLEEMIAFGEEHYVHPERNRVCLWVYEDDADLIDVLAGRGYERRDEPVAHHLEYVFSDLPDLKLPEGFRSAVRSSAAGQPRGPERMAIGVRIPRTTESS